MSIQIEGIRPPFVTNPPIKTYQSNAFALGAFLALGDEVSAILENNFIMLGCVPDLKTAPRPILFFPFVSPEKFPQMNMGTALPFRANSSAELCAAIISSLRHQFLVRLCVDEYYIPDRRAYRKKRRLHDVLVVAVSHDAKCFELMGYCADGRYRASSCSPQQLCEAYFAAVEKMGKDGFLAFKAESTIPIPVDVNSIRHQLEVFLQSRSPSLSLGQPKKQAEPILYGLSAFDACERYARSLRPSEWLDRRVFSLIAEHSEMMLRRTTRMESLVGKEIPKEPAKQAVFTAKRLRLLSMLPEQRRSYELFAEMGALFVRLKNESQAAADTLLQRLHVYGNLDGCITTVLGSD